MTSTYAARRIELQERSRNLEYDAVNDNTHFWLTIAGANIIALFAFIVLILFTWVAVRFHRNDDKCDERIRSISRRSTLD